MIRPLLACLFLLPAAGLAEPTVLAAASTGRALDAALAEAGIAAAMSYGASGILARQIEQGAPADIYVSANPKWMDYLVDAGLVDPSTVSVLMSNALVLIAPKGTPPLDAGVPDAGVPDAGVLDAGVPDAGVLGTGKLGTGVLDTGKLDAGKLGRILQGESFVMADPQSAPVGAYGLAALETLGLWPQIAPSFVPVRNTLATVAAVARGEAALGLVYASDAAGVPGIRVVWAVPADSHPPIRYLIAPVAQGEDPEAAAHLLDYLLGSDCAAVLEAHGFLAVGEGG